MWRCLKVLLFGDFKNIVRMKQREYIRFTTFVFRIVIWGFLFASFVFILFYSSKVINDDQFFKYMRVSIGMTIYVSLFFILIQSCLSRYHEQGRIALSKSHKAIELINKWNETLTPEVMFARSIVDKLDTKMSHRLFCKEEIRISMGDYKTLCSLTGINTRKTGPKRRYIKKENNRECEHANMCEVANSKKLTMLETIWLRSLVMRYLNALEVIMYAWKADVIDQEIVEKEFDYLVSSARDGTVVLGEFRKAAGQESFPGIFSFCDYISKKQEKKINEIKVRG